MYRLRGARVTRAPARTAHAAHPRAQPQPHTQPRRTLWRRARRLRLLAPPLLIAAGARPLLVTARDAASLTSPAAVGARSEPRGTPPMRKGAPCSEQGREALRPARHELRRRACRLRLLARPLLTRARRRHANGPRPPRDHSRRGGNDAGAGWGGGENEARRGGALAGGRRRGWRPAERPRRRAAIAANGERRAASGDAPARPRRADGEGGWRGWVASVLARRRGREPRLAVGHRPAHGPRRRAARAAIDQSVVDATQRRCSAST